MLKQNILGLSIDGHDLRDTIIFWSKLYSLSTPLVTTEWMNQNLWKFYASFHHHGILNHDKQNDNILHIFGLIILHQSDNEISNTIH